MVYGDHGSRVRSSWTQAEERPSKPCATSPPRAPTTTSPTRYYQDSDSCRPHPDRQVSSLHSHTRPSVPPPTTRTTRSSLYTPKQRDRCVPDFAITQQARRRSTPNRVRLLQTASSLPVALHPASRRRSYPQLRGLGLPRHGLPPCCVCALASALGPDLSGRFSSNNRRASRQVWTHKSLRHGEPAKAAGRLACVDRSSIKAFGREGPGLL